MNSPSLNCVLSAKKKQFLIDLNDLPNCETSSGEEDHAENETDNEHDVDIEQDDPVNESFSEHKELESTKNDFQVSNVPLNDTNVTLQNAVMNSSDDEIIVDDDVPVVFYDNPFVEEDESDDIDDSDDCIPVNKKIKKNSSYKNGIAVIQSDEDEDDLVSNKEKSKNESESNVSTLPSSHPKDLTTNQFTTVDWDILKPGDLIKPHCETCNKTYQHLLTKFNKLLKNCLICKNEVLFKCEKCGIRLNTYISIHKHVCNCQNYDTNVEANDFKEQSKRKSNAIVQELHNNSQKIFKCSVCAYKTKWQSNYKNHLKIHAIGQDKTSSQSSKVSRVSGDQKNVALDKRATNIAESSQDEGDSGIDMVQRKRKRNKITSKNLEVKKSSLELAEYWCEECKIRRSRLKVKQNRAIECEVCEELLIIKCKVCQRIYSLVNNFSRHLKKTCANPQCFECDYCTRKFFQKYNFQLHIIAHMRNS